MTLTEFEQRDFEQRFPYKVAIKYPALFIGRTQDRWLWCREHAGDFDIDWYRSNATYLDHEMIETYHFVQQEHAVWFALRWL